MADNRSAGYPKLGPLYVKQTERSDGSVVLPGALSMIGKLSVTSQFKVSLHLSNVGTVAGVRQSNSNKLLEHLSKTNLLDSDVVAASYDFYCSEASLPGSTMGTTTESGSHQGIIETFPTHRIYSPVDITFYVDTEFRIIRIFEEWMNYINPVHNTLGVKYSPTGSSGQGSYKNSSDFFRLTYPENYKKIISITKFERDFREDKKDSNKLKGSINTVTYRLIDAYPDNISSIPITYQGSEITKANIRFAYSRHVIETSQEKA